MANEDRDMELDRSLYEEDPAYEADTYFGERIDDMSSRADDSALDDDLALEDDEMEDTPAADGFGESLTPDELDTTQSEDMSENQGSDSADEGHESLLDKAKHKLNDMANRDDS